MSTKQKSSSGEEFLRSFTGELRTAEDAYEAMIEIAINPTKRVGVVRVDLTATGVLKGTAKVAKIAYISAEYPNGHHGTLEGFLFGQAMKLSKMLAEYREGEAATVQAAF